MVGEGERGGGGCCPISIACGNIFLNQLHFIHNISYQLVFLVHMQKDIFQNVKICHRINQSFS